MSGFGQELWRRRVRTAFNIIDFNHDGELTDADYHAVADRYIELAKLNEVAAKQTRRKIQGIYKEFLGHLGDKPITHADFVDAFQAKGQIHIGQSATFFFGFLFDLMDPNGDGVISKDEYHLFAQVFQLSPEVETKSFATVDENHDGKISYEEFVGKAVEYFTGKGDEDTNFLFGPLVD